MKTNPRTSASAFTLIELLAVVAIMLLLLSLLVPGLSRAKGRAEFSVCASNLRQIGAAANLHAADKDGEWPDCWQWVWSTGAKTGSLWIEWTFSNTVERGTIRPYMGETYSKAFLCPTFNEVYKLNALLPAGTIAYVSYDMNEYFRTNYLSAARDGRTQGWAGHEAVHRVDIRKPAQEGVFCEEDPWPSKYDTGFMNNMCFGTGADALGSFHLPADGDLNNGYGNVWFADGHVDKVHPSDSSKYMTPEAARLNYR